MSDGKAEDCGLRYFVGDEVIGSSNLHEVLDNSTANPAYGCITLDKRAAKTGDPEGPYEQPGSVSSCHVETNECSKKANSFPLKNGITSPTYPIALVVAVVLLIAAGIAIIVAFVEISKLHSEVTVLQSTSPEQLESIQALQSAIDSQINDVRKELNSSEKSVEALQRAIDLQFSDVRNELNNSV